MKPSLNLTTILRADLDEAVSATAAAGFEAVELWVDSLERYLQTHTVEDLRELLKRHRMHVLSIGDIESITFCDPAQRERLRSQCERLASIAAAISCPYLVASASVRPRGVDDSAVAAETEAALGSLLEIVEPAGVGLALAFRGFMWCAVNSLEQARRAVESHAGRNVGLALDTFDLHNTGVRGETLRTLDPSRIFVMRLSDSADVPAPILSETDRVLPGEGIARLGFMLDALKESGFSEPVSLKVLCPEIWGLEASDLARLVMASAARYFPEWNETDEARV